LQLEANALPDEEKFWIGTTRSMSKEYVVEPLNAQASDDDHWPSRRRGKWESSSVSGNSRSTDDESTKWGKNSPTQLHVNHHLDFSE
jgi:hypothetical protein